MDDRELASFVKSAVEEAVERAIAPIARQMAKLQEDADRAASVFRQDAARAATIATEDRERLATNVRDASERQASEVAEKVVNRMMVSLGLDPENPSAFVQDMWFLKELRETFGTGKKHAMLVFIGILASAIVAGLWTAFKSSVMKP